MNDARTVVPLAFPSVAELTLPGSKSEANRLLVLAALSGATVTVRGATASDDVRHLVTGLCTLGFDAQFVDQAAGVVRVGARRAGAPRSGELFCGNAGTALRFLVSVAAITDGDWTLDGDAHMRRRPIQPLVDAWRRLGVEIDATDGCAPVRVRGRTPAGADTRVDGSQSSQFVSSLLLVGACLPGGLRIALDADLASRGYAELTVATLRRAGVSAELATDHAMVRPGFAYPPATLAVGGDWSSHGIWACLNHLRGSRITATNLVNGSGQPDERLASLLRVFGGEPRAERTIDVEPLPDQFLNLAVVAALTPGTTHLIGAGNTRIKECDRVAVMARELRRCGADLDEHPDGLTIRGGGLHGATIDPEDDHRVAMAFALLGSIVPGVAIRNPGCVTKSYPEFWRDLELVHRQHIPIALIGMRGAGKTTLGRALAERLGSTFVDTDEQFERTHGAIPAFVAKNGWPAFRTLEQSITAAALRPGTVVATGGGAIESPATRGLLRDRAYVVFVDADADLLRRRIAGSDRPSLTGSDPIAELDDVLARRLPAYHALADRTVCAALTTEQQIGCVLNPVQTTT